MSQKGNAYVNMLKSLSDGFDGFTSVMFSAISINSVCYLKPVIICKSYDVQKRRMSVVLQMKDTIVLRICVFNSEIFTKLLIFNRNKLHPIASNSYLSIQV